MSWNEGATIFCLLGWGFVVKLGLVWRMECPLFIFHLDRGQSTFHASFLGEGVKSKNSQVSNMVPKEFPITLQFSPICFGKCCTLFNYILRPKGRNFVIQNRTLHFGGAPNFFCFLNDGAIKLAHCKINKRCVTLWPSHLH
jgi:hypothetical protein